MSLQKKFFVKQDFKRIKLFFCKTCFYLNLVCIRLAVPTNVDATKGIIWDQTEDAPNSLYK